MNLNPKFNTEIASSDYTKMYFKFECILNLRLNGTKIQF